MEAQAGKHALHHKALPLRRNQETLTLFKPENLGGSGLDVVINQVMFAIIGAIALETGTATASRVVRERIFKRTYGFS